MTAGTAQPVVTPPPGNTIRAATEALFRHKTLFFVTAAVIALATIAVTILTPKTYESEMNVLVRNARPDYLISPERSNGQLPPADVTEERINSEMDVLRSKDIADVVVDPNWTATPLNQRTPTQVKDHEKAIVEFSKHLTVEAMRKSNVIRVAYVASDPREATDTVERLLTAFLAKQHEIERSSGASSFFATEADRYKQELDRAQQELAGYQQSNQIVSLTGKEDTLQEQITSLEDAIRSTQVAITEADQRVTSDKHQLAMLPARLATMQRSVPNTQAVEQLTALLTTYENKRTELLSRYQPTDRLVTEVEQQIATTSRDLATARATNGQESTTDVNPVYQQVKSTLTTSTTDLAALRGRLADLNAQHARLRQQLVDVEGSTVDYSTLQTRVTELQNNYQLYQQKKNEAQIADAMDEHQLVNVAVAERPTFSAKPYRPQILLNLALGLFTALFLGLCAVFFAELGRDTIATPSELESISTIPVLATVPLVAEPFQSFTTGRRPPNPPTQRGPAPVAPATPSTPLMPSGGTATAASIPAEQEAPIASSPSVEPEAQMEPILPAEPLPEPARLDRTHLMTFEQLAASTTAARPPRPVSPFHEPAAPAAVQPEPSSNPTVEPASQPVPDAPQQELPDPNHRMPNRYISDGAIPVRSRLTPSQRMQLRRPAITRDRDGRVAYVTYTIDQRS